MKLIIKIVIIINILIIISRIYNYEGFISPSINSKNNKDTYIINDNIGGKKSVIYNVTKFTNLPNDLGNAIKFNGISSYMVIPKINLSNYSISFIFKQKNVTSNQILLSSTSGGFLVQIEKSYLTFTMYSEEQNLKIAYKNQIEVDKWYHLVITYNGIQIKLYINGNLTIGNIRTSVFCKSIIIGTDSSKRFFFNGFIGKIRVLQRILAKNEICSIYNLCEIIDETNPEKIEEKKRKAKCKFIPAGDTKAKCSEICSDKPNCNEDICKNLCNNCDDAEYCSWLKKKEEDKTCKFIPYGPSKVSCINICNKENNCDYMTCQNICLNCQDKEMCRWIIPPPPPPKEEDPIEPPPKYDPEGKPIPPNISVKTYNNKVKIIWNRPYNGDAPIEAYVCFLFKTFKINEGVKINMVPFPKCEECTHIINDLHSNETYSVGIRAYNKLGLSLMSNIESFIPKLDFKSPKQIIKPPKLPDLDKYEFCNK